MTLTNCARKNSTPASHSTWTRPPPHPPHHHHHHRHCFSPWCGWFVPSLAPTWFPTTSNANRLEWPGLRPANIFFDTCTMVWKYFNQYAFDNRTKGKVNYNNNNNNSPDAAPHWTTCGHHEGPATRSARRVRDVRRGWTLNRKRLVGKRPQIGTPEK